MNTLRTALLLALAAVQGTPAAQVRTDASLGQAASTLAGPNYAIPQSLGRLAGNNLFHSFQTFSIGNGESASFTTTTAGISNVIARVTGGELSTINGPVRLTPASGAPAFYFINPAGVTFGAGGAVNVPGALHVSTADHLRFPDGDLHASLSRSSTFSSATPESFGFLGSARAPITIAPAVRVTPARGSALNLIAGDIVIDGGITGTFGAPLRIAATGQEAATVPLAGALPALAGSVQVNNDAVIILLSHQDRDSGTLSIGAGTVDINYAGIYNRAETDRAEGGGSIDIRAADRIHVGDFTEISATAFGSAPGGDVRLQARDIRLDSGAVVKTGSEAGAQGGMVSVSASDGLVINGATVGSYASGAGTAGAISLSAADITLDGVADVFSQLDSGARGTAIALSASRAIVVGRATLGSHADGGGDSSSVTLNAPAITLGSGAKLYTRVNGAGRGGDVTLAASGDLRLGGAEVDTRAYDIGASGAIRLGGASISMSDGATVASSGFDSAQTGLISIATPGRFNAGGGSEVLSLAQGQGAGTTLTVSAASVELTGGSSLYSVGDNGQGGNVRIDASGDMRLDTGGKILVAGNRAGNGGALSINAGNLSLAGDARSLSSISSGADMGNNAGGPIDINVRNTLSISGGAFISGVTVTSADAGRIGIAARDVVLDGGRISNATVGSTGNGGNIDIAASGSLSVRNHGVIASSSGGAGDAGSIRIEAGSVALANKSFVSSSSTAADGGKAGNIAMTATGAVTVEGESFIDSSTSSRADAGNVTIAARDVALRNGGSVSSFSQQAGPLGNGGSIGITASGLFDIAGGSVFATTLSDGDAGAIRISAGEMRFAGGDVHSQVLPGGRGNGGLIEVRVAGALDVTSGTFSSSSSGGSAGTVLIRAKNIGFHGSGSGINAAAFAGSVGQVGSIDVAATEAIRFDGGASVHLDNFAVVKPGEVRLPSQITLAAPLIVLDNALVSTAAPGNVDAGAIRINAADRLLIRNAAVQTVALDGNGGAIMAHGGKLFTLENSSLSTSVFGVTGDGGDIAIAADVLLMKTGFIQANTAADFASGGAVQINVGALIASGGSLQQGGAVPLVFQDGAFGANVIQAAAPTGIAGEIALASPALDVSGSLLALNPALMESGGLGRDPCHASVGSAFVPAGRGGLPATGRSLLAPLSVALKRAAPGVALQAFGRCE